MIHVIVTPFGQGLSPDWGPVDDLIVLGAGGLLYLGGYRDAGPVAASGGQSRYAASIFAAVATLVALIDRERSGRGTTIDVSAQECIAQALEDSVPTFALTGQERMRYGTVAREAGTGMYACSDGYVSMVAGRLGTARAWSESPSVGTRLSVSFASEREPLGGLMPGPAMDLDRRPLKPEAA